MRPAAFLHLMPRALEDIDDCLAFVGRHPRGRPDDRRRDIRKGLMEIRELPRRAPVRAYRPGSGLELRCYWVAQFGIIYAFLPASEAAPMGIVSIRAVRHWRVRNVFRGVRESHPAYSLSGETSGG